MTTAGLSRIFHAISYRNNLDDVPVAVVMDNRPNRPCAAGVRASSLI